MLHMCKVFCMHERVIAMRRLRENLMWSKKEYAPYPASTAERNKRKLMI